MITEYINIDGLYGDLHSPGDNYTFACRRLITQIEFIRNKYQLKNQISFNRLYIPHTIFNLIAVANRFMLKGCLRNSPGTMVDTTDTIGTISGMLVYVVPEMNRDELIFSFDKSILRENKIESIIDDVEDLHMDEVTLKVKSEFI